MKNQDKKENPSDRIISLEVVFRKVFFDVSTAEAVHFS